MTNDQIRRNDEARITKYSVGRDSKVTGTAELEFWEMQSQSGADELREEPNGKLAFDLEERTARFGEEIIRFGQKIPRSPVNNRLIERLIGGSTSVGANYCEADDGVSRKDFKHKIGICRKEARETKFFLRMVACAEPDLKPEARVLWQEARELHLIFCAIWRKLA